MRTTKPSKTRRRTRGDYQTIRTLLLQRREELMQQMSGGRDDSPHDRAGIRYPDVSDRAADSQYDLLADGVAEVAAAGLHKIERALSKIDDKTYGRCETCGKPIPKARLRMLPFANLCVRCQRELEEEQARR